MNLYDISYCWKKAKPTCTYIVVVIFWRMIRPQKYDDHLGCHCMIVMCFHESHWCFAATSMLPEAWSFSMRELLSANGSKQGDSVKRIKIEHRKVIALMDSGTVLSLLLWQMWWMYSNGYYGLQMFAVPKIVQNCDDMGASGSRNFKWARVRPGSKHLRSLLDWCLKRSMFDQHVWPDSSFAPLRHFGCWMLCRPSWLMRTPRMKKMASVKRAKMRSISQTLVSLARLWMHDSHWFARCWITAASS